MSALLNDATCAARSVCSRVVSSAWRRCAAASVVRDASIWSETSPSCRSSAAIVASRLRRSSRAGRGKRGGRGLEEESVEAEGAATDLGAGGATAGGGATVGAGVGVTLFAGGAGGGGDEASSERRREGEEAGARDEPEGDDGGAACCGDGGWGRGATARGGALAGAGVCATLCVEAEAEAETEAEEEEAGMGAALASASAARYSGHSLASGAIGAATQRGQKNNSVAGSALRPTQAACQALEHASQTASGAESVECRDAQPAQWSAASIQARRWDSASPGLSTHLLRRSTPTRYSFSVRSASAKSDGLRRGKLAGSVGNDVAASPPPPHCTASATRRARGESRSASICLRRIRPG